MPPQFCDEPVCLSSYITAANDVDDSRQADRGSTGMEAAGMTVALLSLIMSFTCSLRRLSLASLCSCGTPNPTPVAD